MDTLPSFSNRLTRDTGAALPIICGAMYPSSNPELVAAVSAGGGIGIIQPNSLTHVYGYPFVEGVRFIRSLTDRPVGMNVLLDSSSRSHRERMEGWIAAALEEGVRYFVTSLGKPDWVVKMVHPMGGKVYHDVTEVRWAEKGAKAGVDGLTAVNRRSGGHVGTRSAEDLLRMVRGFGLPVVCAGGIGRPEDFVRALEMGYDGVQMGTRFLATTECLSSEAYKEALVAAGEEDIILTERLTGIPVAVLRTPFIEAMGTRIGPLTRLLFRWSKTRKWMRRRYMERSMKRLGEPVQKGKTPEYWQAGQSVAGVEEVLPAAEILKRFAAEAVERGAPGFQPKS